MKTPFLLSILFVSVMNLAFAKDATSKATKKKDEQQSDMPIDLAADKGFYDQKTGVAVYEGNVVVEQAEMKVWSDKLVILLKEGAAEHIEAEGKPVKFEYKGQDELIKGQAKRVDYEVVTTLVTLTGNAVVTQGDDKVTGDKLTYNLEKETIGGSRIKMTFQPKK